MGSYCSFLRQFVYFRHYSQSLRFSNKPIQLEKPWLIIVFSNFGYVDITEIWYNQLVELGHWNHRIYAVDTKTYTYFSSPNKTDIFGHPFRIFYPAHDSTDLLTTFEMGNHNLKLLHLWEIRIKTVEFLIRHDSNVMMTDVDSIFLKYQNLKNLPKNIDAFYGLGTKYPKNVYNQWGLVLHQGFFAFYSNFNSKVFWRILVKNCKRCDDQALINRVLLKNYGIEKFRKIPGSDLSVAEGKVQDFNPESHITGFNLSKTY